MKSTRLLVGTLTATLFSLGVAHAEFTWPRANTPNSETLFNLHCDGNLEGGGAQGKFVVLENPSESGKRVPAEPVFVPGAPNLGQAVSLKPENNIVASFKTQEPNEFTVSCWIKVSTPGFLGEVLNPGGKDAKSLSIGMKLEQNGKIKFSIQLGTSKWVNKSVATDLLDGNWHHIALVVKPNPDGASSNVKISIDANPVLEEVVDGVAPEKFTVSFGASTYEFKLPRAGLGAEMLVDELLIQSKALPEPHKPL